MFALRLICLVRKSSRYELSGTPITLMTASCFKRVVFGSFGWGVYVNFSSNDNLLHIVKFFVVSVIVFDAGSTSLVSVAKHDGPETILLAQ